MRIFEAAPTFAVVAGSTSSNDIIPDMHASQVARHDVIHGHVVSMPPAVLAGEIVSAEYLAPGQFDMRSGTVDHILQADDGGAWNLLRHGADMSATVRYEICFA